MITEETYIAIAVLNDFIFCPYSIYLHSVYMESDEDMYKATPQLSGSRARLNNFYYCRFDLSPCSIGGGYNA